MTKANLLLLMSVVGFTLSAEGQSTSNPALPRVPKTDGTGAPGTSIGSPAEETAVPPGRPVAPSKSGNTEGELNASDLSSAAREARKPGAPSPAAANAVSGSTGPATNSNGGTTARLPIPASARAREPGPTVSAVGPIESGTGNLDTTSLSQQIRALPYSGRAEFLNDLEARLDEVDRELSQVKQSSRVLTWDARKTYLKVAKDAKARSKGVRQLVKDARSAKPEEWAEIRTTLANQYQAFEGVRARAEASSVVGR